MELRPARRVSLLGHPEVNERWLQEQIANDPTLLGLGDLDVRDAERRQPGRAASICCSRTPRRWTATKSRSSSARPRARHLGYGAPARSRYSTT